MGQCKRSPRIPVPVFKVRGIESGTQEEVPVRPRVVGEIEGVDG